MLAMAAAGFVVGAAPVASQGGGDGGDEAARIFAESCVTCHNADQSGRTPSRASLAALAPRAIVQALEDGVMRAEGEQLTREQRVALAEYLSGRSFEESLLPESAYCSQRGWTPLDTDDVRWMGWGGDLAGTGFQPAERAGIDAADVPDLELRWAFAFPEASQARTKPTVVGRLALVADEYGYVYALDTESGCVRWTFQADAGVRSAILVGERPDGGSAVYFVDFRTTAYALDPADGSVLWKNRVGWHPENNNTGSPVLHDGRLIVPISSMEVARGGNPEYRCCTSSGAVAALDATTGYLDWYHRVIEEEPQQVGENDAGTPVYAPAGAPVWSSPTVDPDRGLVYAGTGQNYTRPTTATSDAVLAVDLETGERVWSFQATEGDAFTMACAFGGARGTCPDPAGPDFDFGMAPILVERPDGREILVAGQKSGVVWALDPDDDGAVLWSTRVGRGSALGGIHWGMATDGRRVYAANADRGGPLPEGEEGPERRPGIHALDLETGERIWSAPAPDDTCDGRRGCYAANSAAPTVIPGAVFAGGLDGRIRAYSTEDGSVLWEYDTVREFETVNGVPGRGGSMDGPGPVIADGRLFVNSGYGSFSQMPGNVLLAFSVQRDE